VKIEKISENQIRCTLTKEDLASRQIRLTELVYGNEKTKALFQDMMQQAYFEFGFEVNNAPLMIEAIPLSSDSITLVITKVENPEELDSRFSRFSPEDGASSAEGFSSFSDLIDFFSRISQARRNGQSAADVPSVPGQEGLDTVAAAIAGQREESSDVSGKSEQAGSSDIDTDTSVKIAEVLYSLTKFYLFRDLSTVIRAAHATEIFDGVSSLYKNQDDGNYYLILQKAEASDEQFNRICNVLSEYALSVDFIPGIEQLFQEHMTTILKGQALTDLRSL